MSALSAVLGALVGRRPVGIDQDLGGLLSLLGYVLVRQFGRPGAAPLGLVSADDEALRIAAPFVAGFEGFGDAAGVAAGRVRSTGHPYLCPARVWTIGFGTTRWPDGRPVGAGDAPITRAEALELLRGDLHEALSAVRRLVRVSLTPQQEAALTSFVHNVGAGPRGFGGSTLLRLLNRGDHAGAAGQFERWNRGGGRVLPGLVLRREAERVLFLG